VGVACLGANYVTSGRRVRDAFSTCAVVFVGKNVASHKPRLAKSTVARASSNSPSIRATIPEEIVKEMPLSVGDVLDWENEIRKNRSVMIVKKLE
jgi:hypothetical protein